MTRVNGDTSVAVESVEQELAALKMQLLNVRVSASHSAGSRSRSDLRKQVARLLSGMSDSR